MKKKTTEKDWRKELKAEISVIENKYQRALIKYLRKATKIDKTLGKFNQKEERFL